MPEYGRGLQRYTRCQQNTSGCWKEEEIVIGSMDAVGLYPSLKIEETVGICLDMALKAKIKFEGGD